MSNKKQFYNFVIPSVGAMLVTGLYYVVDGIFVGRGVGAVGLASVNITVPFISLLTAVSMMITMGGATLTSISFGKNENEKANNYFNISLLLVVIFSLGMTLVSVLFPNQIVKMLGASDQLVEGASTYLKYYVTFGIFFCGSSTMSAFVRNDGNPKLAFGGMIVGAISNVFLDWLFIFPLGMGIKGAAIASGLGQILACLVLSLHFIKKKGVLRLRKPKIDKKSVGHIIKVGTPEFVTQMSQPVIILCYNFIVMKAFGEIGVSAFSVISYLLVIIIAIFIGLAQGIQPLISRSNGEGDREKEKYFFNKGIKVNVLLSILVYVFMIIFGKYVISIFNTNSELIELAYNCIIVYGISFIFAAVNIVYTTYYLATKKTKLAMFIAIMRSFVCSTLFIFLMPSLLGISAIWTGIVVAEFVVMVLAITLNKRIEGTKEKKSKSLVSQA